MKEYRGIYIAWVRFQRRAESIARMLDLQVIYVPKPFGHRVLLPISYLVQGARTLRSLWLHRHAPSIWVQVPPTFLIYGLWIMRPFMPNVRFVMDCHNSAFRGLWARVPGFVRLGARLGQVVVHNEEVRKSVSHMLPGRLAYVVTDPPAHLSCNSASAFGTVAASSVIVPCSFAADEPIDVLIQAAVLCPEITWYVTGSRSKAIAKGFVSKAPGNVVFTDYLSLDSFNTLFLRVDGVVGLTSAEGIQLSVANEAVGAGKALLLSDTSILREMFSEAASFTPNSPKELAAAARLLVLHRDQGEARSVILSQKRKHIWLAEAKAAGLT